MGGTLFINPYLSWMPNLFRLSDVAELVAERLPSDSTEARERCLLAAGDIPHLNVRDWSPIEMECLFGAANDLVEEWVVRARWDTTEVFSNLAALCCADPRVAKPHYSQMSRSRTIVKPVRCCCPIPRYGKPKATIMISR